MSTPALADTVQLYAAGSLKTALTDVAKAFEAKTGNKVEAKYGASGLLRKEITDGAKADIFASANMEHPQALNDDGTSGPVRPVHAQQTVRTGRSRGSTVYDQQSACAHAGQRSPRRLHLYFESRSRPATMRLKFFTKAETLKPGAQERLEQKGTEAEPRQRQCRPARQPPCLWLARR